MKPLVSIIIVNWNGMEYIKQCIDSILKQSYTNYEIIFVDNASSDGSIEFVEKTFPKIKIIKNKENLGFAQGNNIGISKSKGAFIALFNPDAVADEEWIEILVSALESSDKIGGVTGKMFYLGNQYGKNSVFCSWSKLNPFSANPYNFHNDEPTSKVDYLAGGAMMIKSEVIKKIGLLDPEYFLYFDETDWCARMIKAGYDLVYIPTALVWHAISASISESNKKIYFMERSRIRFAIKNFDLPHLPIFLIIIFAETLFLFGRDVTRMNFSRTKIRLRAIGWNILKLKKTIQQRKKDISHIKKNGMVYSYNNSLPLRKLKTGSDMVI